MTDLAVTTDPVSDPKRTIAYQGIAGAFSHLACQDAMADYSPLACENFDEAFKAVQDGRAARAMIPIENSLAGRVADIHALLPDSDLYIIAEHFQTVNHNLLTLPDAELGAVREVHSHIHALGQCRRLIRELGIKPVVHADTAGACKMVAERGDPAIAAIGSSLAAEIYALSVARRDVHDLRNNITRFLIMARERITPHRNDGPAITSFMFGVRSVPAALYKALGGFATNKVNITKLESYMRDGSFSQAEFYMDIEGHPDDEAVKYAFEELRFFSTDFRVFGTYPMHPFRQIALQ